MRAVLILTASAAAFAAEVHVSPMAGRWFPGEKSALEQSLQQSHAASERRTGNGPPRKQLAGLVVPHAGIQYSGAVAASAYRLLGGAEKIVVLGFSHRRPLTGVYAPDIAAYSHPLGDLHVDKEAIARLGFPKMSEKDLCDHSLENQLPFLYRAAPGASIVPLYVGALDRTSLAAAARKLSALAAEGYVIVASSDFTHYGAAYQHTPFPNDAELPWRLANRAAEAFEAIGSLYVAEFDRYVAATGDTICGRDPIRLLMAALAERADDVYMTIADFMTSGDVTRDYSTSVSYGALAFYPASAFTVGPAEQKKLLASARQTLEVYLATGKPQAAVVAREHRTTDLEQRTGVFVTVRKKGELRGCIGNLMPRAPLWDTVADRTIASTTSDPRFPPLTAAEGPVTLEISLLTPMKRVTDWRRFRLGQGAALMSGGRSGLLLPQVAAEMKWNARQFLEGLAQKAGLPPDGYRRPDARLYVYDAQVFGE
jgi:AmmeMemoRadiSam system protein B/AmmeMemoRadiSam system protein A